MAYMKEDFKGHIHPLSQVIEELYQVFSKLGFVVAEGPELETEFYNFDALNIPADHPARDMQDTFWVKNKEDERLVMRTQTSPVQIRFMEKNEPPLRIIVPGKVFRNEATDATHETQFFQLEGLVVDKNISMANLKWTMTELFKGIFGEEVEILFRPSYFPFTEPSLEVFMKWKGKLLEMAGAGMVHPNVFKAAGLDAQKWKGFAFGLGIDRLVMLKYDIPDVRMLYSADLRLVNQF